jgi:hypothetical protein
MKILLAIAAIASLVVSASAAMAQSFSGKWPLTGTKSIFENGTYCLTVTDNGSEGWPHSGSATIAQEPCGFFQVIKGKFVADIVVPLQGQNGVLLFTSAGRNGIIGSGAVVLIEGGEPLDSGEMLVGKKGRC